MLKTLIAGLVLVASSSAQTSTGVDAALRAQLRADAVDAQVLDVPPGLPAAFAVDVRFGGVAHRLELRRRAAARAPGFQVVVVGADGVVRDAGVPEVRTYRGTVRGRGDLSVAAALDAGGLYATVVSDAGVVFVVQPVADLLPMVAGPGLHVAHAPAPLPDGSCGVVDAAVLPEPPGRPATVSTGGVPMVAEIAFDCDHDFFQFKGASVAAVVADVERTLDATNAVYERDVDITHQITRIVVRTAEPDPYSGNDAGVILGTQFRGEWNGNQAGVPRDMAHFVTSRTMGNILGLAYVGVVCNLGSAYGLSRFDRAFSQNASVLCHELGHNWSCPHCLDTCDVMCGCGIAGGFGPNDRAQIDGFRDSRTCLRRLVPELVAHWRLDETAGVSAQDSGPNGLSGTLVGGTVPGRPGARAATAGAAGFDGVDDAVAIPDGPGLSGLTGGFSVSVWVRPSGGGGPAQRFFANDMSWWVGTYFGRLSLALRGRRDFRSVATLPGGQWSHVAVVADGNNGVTFYVDGQRIDSVGGWVDPNPTGSAWYVGSRDGVYEWFDGDVDDVQVYDGVLTEAVVSWLFAHPGESVCTPTWENYGAGLAGTLRTPTLTLDGLPAIGRTVTARVHSASPWIIYGVGILGFAPGSTPLLGGTILVDLSTAWTFPQLLGPSQPIDVPLPIPNDPALSCASFYLQFAHADAGAVQGVAMTPGLRITVGG